MKKVQTFVPLAVLVLLVSWLAVPQGRWAQSQAAPSIPPDPTPPELGPFLNIWLSGPDDNTTPAVAYGHNHDEYLVTWQNERSGWTDIYARRVSGDGTLRAHRPVISTANHWNQAPVVAYTPVLDRYLVAYTYNGPPPNTTFDVKGRFVSWDLNDLFGEKDIRVEVDSQHNQAIAYNSQMDEFLVVYENWWAGGLRDIAAQRITSTGALLAWRNIATGHGEWRYDPSVAYNEARNEYLITYTYSPNATQGNGDLFAKVASANLGTLSTEFTILDDSYDQQNSAVAAGPDEYLVTWEDGTAASADYDIYGRRVSGGGEPLGGSGGFRISSTTNARRQDPDVAFGGRCGYLVTWSHAEGGSPGWPPTLQDIYGSRVPLGQDAPAGSEFVIDNDEGLQSSPAVACAPWGRCLVVEQDNSPITSGRGFDIQGRMVWMGCPYTVYVPQVLRNFK